MTRHGHDYDHSLSQARSLLHRGDNTAAEYERAVRAVLARSSSVSEAALLLRMLGLHEAAQRLREP